MSKHTFWLGSELPPHCEIAPDHAQAGAAMLRRFADRLEHGESGFDMGPELVLVARMIARRT